MTIYEKLMFTKRLHYIPFWFIIGAIIFLQQEVIVYFSGETELLILRILISFYVSLAAIFIISLKNLFMLVTDRLKNIIEFPLPHTIWVKQKIHIIGTFSTMTVRGYILIIMVALTSTVLWLGVPYHNTIPKLDFILSLQFFVITSAHMIFGVVELLKTLKQIVVYPLKTPFYLSKHPAVILLANFYARTSVYALIIVFWLASCVWFNPYGLIPILITWWLFTSALPMILFIWTFIQSHALMLRIKQESMDIISNQIQDSLHELRDNPNKESTDKLVKLMSMQDMAAKMPEWPFSIQGVTTFLATFLFPIINFGLTIFLKYKK